MSQDFEDFVSPKVFFKNHSEMAFPPFLEPEDESLISDSERKIRRVVAVAFRFLLAVFAVSHLFDFMFSRWASPVLFKRSILFHEIQINNLFSQQILYSFLSSIWMHGYVWSLNLPIDLVMTDKPAGALVRHQLDNMGHLERVIQSILIVFAVLMLLL